MQGSSHRKIIDLRRVPFIDVDGKTSLETVFKRNETYAKKTEDYTHILAFVLSDQASNEILYGSSFYSKLLGQGLAFTDLNEAINYVSEMKGEAPESINEGGEFELAEYKITSENDDEFQRV